MRCQCYDLTVHLQRLRVPFHLAIKKIPTENESDIASADKCTVIIRKVIIIRGRNFALRVSVIQTKYFRNFSEIAVLNHFLLMFYQKC